MKPVRVSLEGRSYDVAFGPLGPALARGLKRLGFGGRAALVITSTPIVRAGHVRKVLSALRAARVTTHLVTVADGESSKTLATVSKLYKAGVNTGLDRRSLIVAVGGGVVTDMAGFVAATYMRGIDFVSIPTTVLGMVDAAIGGKTGVDTPDGKNLVGAFWQPRLVWVDTATLRTLPRREWRTGFAEVAKYGVIGSPGFFSWLEKRIAERRIMADWRPQDVDEAVRRSAHAKAAVVSADERETPLGGGREILNFGHTAGHALEAATGYRRLTHGEAISVGMAVAGEIALALKLWKLTDHTRMVTLLRSAGLPVRFPRLRASERATFWSALKKDKKNVGARLRFVLPRSIGRVEVRSGIPIETVRRAAIRCGF